MPAEGSETGIFCLRCYVHVSPLVDFAGREPLQLVFVFSLVFGTADRAQFTFMFLFESCLLSTFHTTFFTFLCGVVSSFTSIPFLHVESVVLTA